MYSIMSTVPYTMIMANNHFLHNENINESNSLVELTEQLNPGTENEINIIDHSRYYTNEDFRETDGSLRILNLNCRGLKSNFGKLETFLMTSNNNDSPISIIALQETHITSRTDITAFLLPDYTLVFDLARLNNFGGVALYVHNSFTFSRLPIDKYNQNSDVYESIYIEIFNKKSKLNNIIIGNVYRRPSTMAEHVSTFITEFSETLNTVHERSKKAYISGDFNIDLLKIHMNSTFNTFFENVTSQGFYPKITRPTRISENSNTLIDNIFTNNLGNKHTSGILTSPIADHFMNFCILEGDQHISQNSRYIEIESITANSIQNFKKSISKADIISKIDTSISANPNTNYNILSSIISNSKDSHIPRKIRKLNKRKHKIKTWMTDELLNQINKKKICIANGNLPLILINIMGEGLILKLMKKLLRKTLRMQNIFFITMFLDLAKLI